MMSTVHWSLRDSQFNRRPRLQNAPFRTTVTAFLVSCESLPFSAEVAFQPLAMHLPLGFARILLIEHCKPESDETAVPLFSNNTLTKIVNLIIMLSVARGVWYLYWESGVY